MLASSCPGLLALAPAEGSAGRHPEQHFALQLHMKLSTEHTAAYKQAMLTAANWRCD